MTFGQYLEARCKKTKNNPDLDELQCAQLLVAYIYVMYSLSGARW